MRRVNVFLLAVFLLGVLADGVRACVTTNTGNQPREVTLTPNGPDTWRITFHGYKTVGVVPGQFCTCALIQVGLITAVDAVEYTNTNGGPFAGFDFTSNPNSVFGGFSPAVGFASAISQPVNPDLEVVISFDVTLVPGTTFTDLKDALADEEVMIATDEADASGAPSGLLQQTYPAGPISLGGSCAPDSDGDGIQDSVDQSPSFSSNSFVDGSTTPTTRGGILPRGDQDVCASDAPFPDGVRVESLSGGATPATVNSLCFAGTRDVSVRLAAGDCITVTCRPGPLAEVKNRCATAARGPAVGDVDVTLLTDGGQVVGTVVLPGGQTLLYDQQTLNVSAPDSNDTTLTVVPTSGDPLSLPPGGNVTPPAPTAIPAASTWGLTVFALFLLVSAKVYFSRRRTMQA